MINNVSQNPFQNYYFVISDQIYQQFHSSTFHYCKVNGKIIDWQLKPYKLTLCNSSIQSFTTCEEINGHFLFQVTQPQQYLSHTLSFYSVGFVDNVPYLICNPWNYVTGMDYLIWGNHLCWNCDPNASKKVQTGEKKMAYSDVRLTWCNTFPHFHCCQQLTEALCGLGSSL